MTITEFLLARIAEDEAKIAAMTGEARRVKEAPIFRDHPARWLDSVDIFVSPARWTAECAAKRRIVESHADGTDCLGDAGTVCDACHYGVAPCHGDILRTMAAVYADHPDYDQAWSPS